MHLGVVSLFPPALNGISQYGWNVVHGLARTNRFSAITVLAQRLPRPSLAEMAPAHFDPAGQPGVRPGLVATRRLWSRDDLLSAVRLTRAIQAARPDVLWFNLDFMIFGTSRPANFLGLLAPAIVRRSSRPVVVTLHQIHEATPPNSIGAKNGRLTHLGLRTATRLLLRADVVCVTLRRYQQTLQAHYGAANVRHIPHGAFTPLELLPPPAPSSGDNLLFFGFAAPFKGLGHLLEAYERLKRRRPQVTLTIASTDHPRFPGYLARLQAGPRARNGSGPGGIRWLGPQTEAQLREVFAQARLVVLPYTATTGASSVLHRAAAFGRPVVASDLLDLRAAAEEEGLLAEYVPAGDAPALAVALETLLADRPRLAGIAAHNLEIMRSMTLDCTCAHYLELFERITRQTTSARPPC